MLLLLYMQLCEIAPGTISYREFLNFFVQQWAPAVNTIHQAKSGIVVSFLGKVSKAIKDLPVHEVYILYIIIIQH